MKRPWTSIEIADLKRRIALGQAATTIAADIGRSPGSVMTKASMLGLRFQFKRKQIPVLSIVDAYNNGASMNALALIHNVAVGTIRLRLREARTLFRSREEQVCNKWTPTPVACQVIDGLMLGDGHCATGGFIQLNQRADRLQWLEQLQQILFTEGVFCSITSRNAGYYPYRGAVKVSRPQYSLRSYTYPYLHVQRERWYLPHPHPDPKHKWLKIVPRDLALTSLVLAHWFAGDGSARSSGTLKLCTHNFRTEDVKFLIELLYARFAIRASLAIDRRVYPVLIIDDAAKFANLVRPLLPLCFQYKLTKV